jgi:hypothetical protein
VSGLISAGVETVKADVFSAVSAGAGVNLESAAFDGADALAGPACVTEDSMENAPELTAGTSSIDVAVGEGMFSVKLAAFTALVCVPGVGPCPSRAIPVCATEGELFAAWLSADVTPASCKTCAAATACGLAADNASANPFCEMSGVTFVVFVPTSFPADTGETKDSEFPVMVCAPFAGFITGLIRGTLSLSVADVALPLPPVPRPSIESDPDALPSTPDAGTTNCGAGSRATAIAITLLAASEVAPAGAFLRAVPRPLGTLEFVAVAALAGVLPSPFPSPGGAPGDAGGGPKKPCTAAANCAANPPAPGTPPADGAAPLPGTLTGAIRRLLEPISLTAFTLVGAPDFLAMREVHCIWIAKREFSRTAFEIKEFEILPTMLGHDLRIRLGNLSPRVGRVWMGKVCAWEVLR